MKLRRQGLAARRVTMPVQTDRHEPVEQRTKASTARLPVAIEDTRELARVAAWCLRRAWRPGYAYVEAGVLLGEPGRLEAVVPGLLDARDHGRTRRLMAVVDAVNQKQGRVSLRLAAASPLELEPCRTWRLRSEPRSPRWTPHRAKLPMARVPDECS